MSSPSPYVLTSDQQNAYDAITAFLLSTTDNKFVLAGYAGTGKSTLMANLLANFDSIMKTKNLIAGIVSEHNKPEIQFTATTNKACEALSLIINQEVPTIHSFLSLRVKKNYYSNKTSLSATNAKHCPANTVLVIDEASYISDDLLHKITALTSTTKVIFVGDPSQLTPVSHVRSPAFSQHCPQVKLKKIMRQAEGNPIIALSTSFRNVVNGEDFFSFTPDQKIIHHLDTNAFEQKISQEFARSDWAQKDSKILAWTNSTVIKYNQLVSQHISGNANFQAGDYAIVNEYFPRNHMRDLKTGESVQISSIHSGIEYGVNGHWITTIDQYSQFMPLDLDAKQKRVAAARKNQETNVIENINKTWIDLRAAYACTINKAQGSTYKSVFIDLDDVSRCRNPNQLARMLYVAVSRAAETVYFKGDIV